MDEKLSTYFFEKTKPEFQQLCIVLHEIITGLDSNIQTSIKWQIPAYDLNGLCFGLGAFKHKVTLFFHRGAEMKDPLNWFKGQEKNKTMRSLQFKNIEDIDGENLELYLFEALRVDQKDKPKTAKKKPIPLPPVPEKLQDELDNNSIAQANWNALNKSNKREFIQWISTAKREETTHNRIQKSIIKLENNRTCWGNKILI